MIIDIPKNGLKRIVIIGGGFGGIQLAKYLAKSNYQIVIIDKNNHHTFQPLLYQVATAALEPGSIAYPIRKILNRYKNVFFRMGEVKEIKPAENKILFDDDEIEYDFAVIATGAKTNYFGNEGLTINSMSMKNIVEAIDLRNMILQNFEQSLTISNERKIKSLRTIVIAGAGPTGVELAGSLGELKTKVFRKDYPEIEQDQIQIILIHSGDRVLPMLSEKSSVKAKRYLEKLGVRVLLNTRVLDYNNDFIQTNTGEEIFARTLIWAAGVTGDPIKGLPTNSINKANRILTNEFMQVNDTKNIFAVGDVACVKSDLFPNGHPQVAPAAIQQGRLLAKNLKEMARNGKPQPFVYKDKGSMATVGKNKAVVEMGRFKFGGFFAWAVWMFVHLMSLVGFRNRLVILFNWVKHYFDSDRGIRLIIRPFNIHEVRRKRRREMENGT